MNVPPWLLNSLLIGAGVVLFWSYRSMLKLINITEGELKGEMKELRRELHDRVSNSETKLLAAIEKLPNSLVSTMHCDNKQDIWLERFRNLIDKIETASETRATADKVAHDSLNDTQTLMATKMDIMSDCMTKLAKNKEC